MTEERRIQLLKAESKQQYAYTILILMTCMNVVLGILMVYKIFPIWLGMVLSFVGMGLFTYISSTRLMDKGETPWESAEQFHARRNKND